MLTMAQHAIAVNNAALLSYKVPYPIPIENREWKEIKKGKVDVQQLKNGLRNYFWNVASNCCMDMKNVWRDFLSNALACMKLVGGW